MRALIVDDSEIVARFLERELSGKGFEVLYAPDAETATTLLAIALVVFAWSESRARQRDAAERTRIPAGQVELSDMRMLVQPDVLNELTGLVKNHSKTYTLTSFNLRITLQDCEAGRCETVGQEEQTISPLVPPGGTGQLSTTVYFAHLGQPRGIRRLSYTVTGTLSGNNAASNALLYFLAFA